MEVQVSIRLGKYHSRGAALDLPPFNQALATSSHPNWPCVHCRSQLANGQGFDPVLVLGSAGSALDVRCYLDEILVPRLPSSAVMKARMLIRGTQITIPLEYVRTEPYVSPKIELSDQRTERVDVRDLPVIFRFTKPQNVNLYPGELVDVFIGK